MQIELTVLLAVLAGVLGFAGFAAGRLTSAKNAGLSEGRIMEKLQHIEKALEKQTTVAELALRTADEALQSSRSAHRRIDELKGV